MGDLEVTFGFPRVTLYDDHRSEEVVKEEALEDRSPTLPAASKDGKSQRVWFSMGVTLPETNIAPENGWLEY